VALQWSISSAMSQNSKHQVPFGHTEFSGSVCVNQAGKKRSAKSSQAPRASCTHVSVVNALERRSH
jgi:hypothetical protein